MKAPFKPVRYDPGADAIYVRFSDASSARTQVVDDQRIIDYAEDGSIVGLEFLEVSAGIDLSAMPLKQGAEALIRQSGHEFNI